MHRVFRMSHQAVFEIYTHPDDLEISIVSRRVSGEKRYAIFMSRGPAGHYKRLVGPPPYADSFVEALESTKMALETTQKMAQNLFENREGAYCYVDQDRWPLNPDEVLTPALAERIIADLRRFSSASTYKYRK